MSFSAVELLTHILDEIKFISERKAGLTKETFLNDEILKRAVVRSFEIIGEATKNLSLEFRKKHPEVDWKRISEFRDVLIHDYFGVDYFIVWDIMNNKIPELKIQIETIIEKEKN